MKRRDGKIRREAQVRTGPTFALRGLVAALCAAGAVGGASALPTGAVVRSGTFEVRAPAVVDGRTQLSVVQQGSGNQRGVVDWTSFSIGASERVQFYQPTAASSVLNRVTGDQASALSGILGANGQVVLVNPNGILISGSARIDTGSFIATTTNISNDNFLAGRLIFDDNSRAGFGSLAGKIRVEDGAIASATAQGSGLVALVAPSVTNAGILAAKLGTVVLGGAEKFTLSVNGLYDLEIAGGVAGALAGQTDTGKVLADGGRILVSAQAVANTLDNVINTSGLLQAARASTGEDGSIELRAVDGGIQVAGAMISSTLTSVSATRGAVEVEEGGLTVATAAGLSNQAAGLDVHADRVVLNGTVATDRGPIIIEAGSGGVQAGPDSVIGAGGGLQVTSTAGGDIALGGIVSGGGIRIAAPSSKVVLGSIDTSGAIRVEAQTTALRGNIRSGVGGIVFASIVVVDPDVGRATAERTDSAWIPLETGSLAEVGEFPSDHTSTPVSILRVVRDWIDVDAGAGGIRFEGDVVSPADVAGVESLRADTLLPNVAALGTTFDVAVEAYSTHGISLSRYAGNAYFGGKLGRLYVKLPEPLKAQVSAGFEVDGSDGPWGHGAFVVYDQGKLRDSGFVNAAGETKFIDRLGSFSSDPPFPERLHASQFTTTPVSCEGCFVDPQTLFATTTLRDINGVETTHLLYWVCTSCTTGSVPPAADQTSRSVANVSPVGVAEIPFPSSPGAPPLSVVDLPSRDTLAGTSTSLLSSVHSTVRDSQDGLRADVATSSGTTSGEWLIGGPGISQISDLGRNGSSAQLRVSPFELPEHVVAAEAGLDAAGEYFVTDAFGRVRRAGSR